MGEASRSRKSKNGGGTWGRLEIRIELSWACLYLQVRGQGIQPAGAAQMSSLQACYLLNPTSAELHTSGCVCPLLALSAQHRGFPPECTAEGRCRSNEAKEVGALVCHCPNIHWHAVHRSLVSCYCTLASDQEDCSAIDLSSYGQTGQALATWRRRRLLLLQWQRRRLLLYQVWLQEFCLQVRGGSCRPRARP